MSGEAPENVRLAGDGWEVPCDVLRDPDQDRDGIAAWIAVPREPVPSAASRGGWAVYADVLPARTALMISVVPGLSSVIRREED